MTLQQLWWTLHTDAYRITGSVSTPMMIRQLFGGETYSYVFWMRICNFLSSTRSPVRVARPLARLALRRLRYRMGINLPHATRIGPGLLIGHAGGIVVNAAAVIGSNCNISHGVTIGSTKGSRAGVPVIGDNVYIGPGAVLIGNIEIHDGAAIGANSVVTSDVPAGCTVAGNPARIVSTNGSAMWVNRTDYPRFTPTESTHDKDRP